MTDKERLEMIKHDFDERSQYGGFIDDYDTLWLVEKVEQYQRDKEFDETIMQDYEKALQEKEEEIHRLETELMMLR